MIKRKPRSPDRFRIDLPALAQVNGGALADLNTKAISKIDAITVKQSVAKHEVGA